MIIKRRRKKPTFELGRNSLHSFWLCNVYLSYKPLQFILTPFEGRVLLFEGFGFHNIYQRSCWAWIWTRLHSLLLYIEAQRMIYHWMLWIFGLQFHLSWNLGNFWQGEGYGSSILAYLCQHVTLWQAAWSGRKWFHVVVNQFDWEVEKRLLLWELMIEI